MAEHDHSSHKHQEGACCTHVGASSVQQSMGEMEFERGIWSAAYDGEDERVQKFLRQGVKADSRDSSGLTALVRDTLILMSTSGVQFYCTNILFRCTGTSICAILDQFFWVSAQFHVYLISVCSMCREPIQSL